MLLERIEVEGDFLLQQRLLLVEVRLQRHRRSVNVLGGLLVLRHLRFGFFD